MKKNIIFILFISGTLLKAQEKKYWLIDTQTDRKTAVSDSISAVKFLDSLSQNNYYFTTIKNVKKNENNTEIFYDKGKNYNEAYIVLSPEISEDFPLKQDFFSKNVDSLKENLNEKYRARGYIFNRIKTQFKGLKNTYPLLEISVIKNKVRTIDDFIFKGYDKIPRPFVKKLEREYRGKIYEEKRLNELNKTLENHPFFSLEKVPQTLYTQDSTKIYLFLERKKSNTFDGVLGFGNDKNEKFNFSGSLNVNFRNMFNRFETVNIFWQRNPDSGQNFDLKTDFPFLFKTTVGTQIDVNIFRQDSTYATVKLLPSLYFHLKNNQKLGLRGRFESSSVTDSLYLPGKDFSKKGVGLWYEFIEPSEIDLFLYKTRLRVEGEYISANYDQDNLTVKQNTFLFSGERNFHISGNNYMNIRGETALLNSKNSLATNELMRFGGWNSLRGFNENSILADFYYFGTAEYRYLLANQAFFDVFAQYGQLNNRYLDLRPQLYSFGFGFNFLLPIGLMSFQISNGSEFGNAVKFGDTKIHWGILSRF